MRFYFRVFLAAALCLCLWRSEAGAEWMRMLPGNVPDGKVIGIAADTYVLDLGLSNGVREGAHYLVYYDDADIADVSGVIIGKYKIPIAVITARAVSMTESICTVERPSNGWLIMEGDRVMPINEGSSDSMKFATLYGNPPQPDTFYAGRWKRIGPITNPSGIIAHYYYGWRLAGAHPYTAANAPGFYYWKPGVAVASAYPLPHSGFIMPPTPETAPAPAPPAAPQPQKDASALYDANHATDSRVIKYLPLTDTARNSFGIEHRQAWNLYQGRRYYDAIVKFADMSARYSMNYLSPYWAGMCALRLNDKDAASEWFGLSLQINPAYQPAKDEMSRMGRL
ncbi:hypothetical protein FACS1894216_10010 [Synergistales bacterium]|nr:hypothetical protein FACS1894216_10010 [Synergistales bacterium]